MKLGSERDAGLWYPMPAALTAVLARLQTLAGEPLFAAQRQIGLSRALRPYVESGTPAPLAPLPYEVELANLYVIADFYPEDGQLSLIEQLRDVVTEHIPEDERRWLDPLKHSSMDLVEVVKEEWIEDRVVLTLRSLGEDRRVFVEGEQGLRHLAVGDILLTRLIRPPDGTNEASRIVAGCALVLSASDGAALFDTTQEYRRAVEVQSGAFGMGEWGEFTKRYGHVLLWNFAQARFDALVEAVNDIRYLAPQGGPFLYALAMYDHDQPRFLCEGVGELKGFSQEPEGASRPTARIPSVECHTWLYCTPSVVTRLTVTPFLLLVECDSAERLEDIKHSLASTFGYALRFRKEAMDPPIRPIKEEDLAKTDRYEVLVTREEERALLRSFLESAYLDWADTASPALRGQTPRHAAATTSTRQDVIDLIRKLEGSDLGLLRTGQAAFDYDKLRSHVGLAESGA
ncbi:hypothetical protein YTPLAS18_35630 [Nitrospira sp.]|nr:hypothetical protein YTPLAS18_35630 [Nitrospira sp.]